MHSDWIVLGVILSLCELSTYLIPMHGMYIRAIFVVLPSSCKIVKIGSYNNYRVVRHWWILRKPAVAVSGRFSAGFQRFLLIFFSTNKKFRNLPETFILQWKTTHLLKRALIRQPDIELKPLKTFFLLGLIKSHLKRKVSFIQRKLKIEWTKNWKKGKKIWLAKNVYFPIFKLK